VIVYDNSEEADPHSGSIPKPKLILHAIEGKAVEMCELQRAPNWTKPILMAAIKVSQ
jgi:hypothetical protein